MLIYLGVEDVFGVAGVVAPGIPGVVTLGVPGVFAFGVPSVVYLGVTGKVTIWVSWCCCPWGSFILRFLWINVHYNHLNINSNFNQDFDILLTKLLSLKQKP